MGVSFSISQLFQLAFGYQSSAFDPKFEQLDPERTRNMPYANYEGAKGGKYSDVNANTGREYYMPITLGGVQLHHPVIRLDIHKHIIETPLRDGNGTVKESIRIEDWSFAIRGLIIAKDREFPEEEVEQLRDLFHRNEALDIVCPITNILWVQPGGELAQAVIKDFYFPEMRGVKGVRAYEIRGVSDTSFDLEEV